MQAAAKSPQVFRFNEVGKVPSLDLASWATKEVRGLEVRLRNALILVNGQVSHGSEIVELPIAVKRVLQIRLGALELLVLELELHLADANLVEQALKILDPLFWKGPGAVRNDLLRPLSELVQFAAVFVCH